MSRRASCGAREHQFTATKAIFVAVLAGTACAAYGQTQAKLYRIGILTETGIDALQLQQRWEAVLRKRGYLEGTNTVFEVRGARENFDLLPKLAAELVQSKVDIILTVSTPPAVAAKQATSTIPILTLSADPIGAGLVKSLAHPGGNVTGIYAPVVDMAPKRLQLLKEAVPGLTSVAILWNPLNVTARLQAKATEVAAQALNLTTFSVEVPNQGKLEDGLQLLHAKRPSGFIVMQDPVMWVAAKKLAEFALKNQLPGFHPSRVFADEGGLMSYGVSLDGLFAAGAIYADKILKGAKPAELPMEQPSRYEFVINLKTAKSMGIKVPESILLRADEVIR